MYEDIYPWVKSKLRDSLNGVDETELDPEIRSVLREILSPFSLTYAGLTDDDKERVDEAAGLRTAVRVHAQYVVGGISTSLRSEATDNLKQSYDDSDALKTEWLNQAAVAIAGTSFGGGSALSAPRFGVNGPSRAYCAERCTSCT